MYCVSSSVCNLALAIQQAGPLAPEMQACAKALPLLSWLMLIHLYCTYQIPN